MTLQGATALLNNVKATSAAHIAETASAADSSGVLGAARIQGTIRNTGDPSEQLTSGKDHSYKPKAKAGGVQRESEGSVVLTIPAKNNAGGGTGPCFGQVVKRGKREGMTVEPSNFPAGLKLGEKVRELGTRLYADAKRSSEIGTTSRTQPEGVTSPLERGNFSEGGCACYP